MVVETTGDRRRDIPIWEMGGKGVFVEGGAGRGARRPGRHRRALGQGPAVGPDPDGLVMAAPPSEATPATRSSGRHARGSAPARACRHRLGRRRAQLATADPTSTFAGLRGNIDTRLAKAAEFDAAVVAARRSTPARSLRGQSPSSSIPT